jgi:DNA-binding NarL/FixJ family response regulator
VGESVSALTHEMRLTARERDVLELLARGLRHEQVAERLGIGGETVRSHVRNASQRLGAANATQAVAIAVRRSLIQT